MILVTAFLCQQFKSKSFYKEYMSCSSYTDCVSGGSVPAGYYFDSLKSTLYFSINFVFYILYAFLMVYTVYNFAFAVYKLIIGNDEETFKTVKEAFYKGIIAAIGLMFLIGARFIVGQALALAGITGGANPFLRADPIP